MTCKLLKKKKKKKKKLRSLELWSTSSPNSRHYQIDNVTVVFLFMDLLEMALRTAGSQSGVLTWKKKLYIEITTLKKKKTFCDFCGSNTRPSDELTESTSVWRSPNWAKVAPRSRNISVCHAMPCYAMLCHSWLDVISTASMLYKKRKKKQKKKQRGLPLFWNLFLRTKKAFSLS